MCLCCCPPAITAIFCLWVQSGFSQGTVAGALTFFPPDPPLYKFERLDENGQPVPDDNDEKEEEQKNNDDERQKKTEEEEKGGDSSGVSSNNISSSSSNKKKKNSSSSNEEVDEEGHYVAREGQTKEQVKSPAQQFTDQARELRKRGLRWNKRDCRDLARNVTYSFSLDPRLQIPRFPSDGEGFISEAVKIPAYNSKKGNKQQAKENNSIKDKNVSDREYSKRNHCAAIVCRVPESRRDTTSDGKPTMTLIYSHGNATDIGAMYPLQAILCHSLECNVVSYDYSGYGESGGVPLESNTYSDIEGVYNWTLQNVAHDNDPSRVILYGQSVGSGPCCHLSQKIDDLGGMILHSPFMSGMRVLTSSRYVTAAKKGGNLFLCCTSLSPAHLLTFPIPLPYCSTTSSLYSALACLDIYPNIDRIRKTKCPTMVIHGKLDEEVQIEHGISLHRSVPTRYQRDPWWVPDRGHNDITEGPGKLAEYVSRLRNFIESLD